MASWQCTFLIDCPLHGRLRLCRTRTYFSGCTTHMFLKSHCEAQCGSDTMLAVPRRAVRLIGKKGQTEHKHLGQYWTPNHIPCLSFTRKCVQETQRGRESASRDWMRWSETQSTIFRRWRVWRVWEVHSKTGDQLSLFNFKVESKPVLPGALNS